MASYRWPEVRGTRQLSGLIAQATLDGVAARQIVADDQSLVHVVTDAGSVYTLRTADLSEAASRIAVAPVEARDHNGRTTTYVHATRASTGTF